MKRHAEIIDDQQTNERHIYKNLTSKINLKLEQLYKPQRSGQRKMSMPISIYIAKIKSVARPVVQRNIFQLKYLHKKMGNFGRILDCNLSLLSCCRTTDVTTLLIRIKCKTFF